MADSSPPLTLDWSDNDRAFLIRLIAEAKTLGIAEITFKDLKVRLIPAGNSQRDAAIEARSYSGAKNPWNTTMPVLKPAVYTPKAEGLKP